MAEAVVPRYRRTLGPKAVVIAQLLSRTVWDSRPTSWVYWESLYGDHAPISEPYNTDNMGG